MPDKFRNKYRISSARLRNWDYGSNAIYFVTICTQNREHYFGEIADGQMNLSETGKMANRFWFEIPNHFPFVQLGEFVVMPNHVHGIIIIDKPINSRNIDFDEMGGGGAIDDVRNGGVDDGAIVETPNLGVSTVVTNHVAPNHVTINNPPVNNGKTDAASAKWKPGILGRLSINTNGFAPSMRVKSIRVLPGNPVFTTILSAITNHLYGFRITSSIIP